MVLNNERSEKGNISQKLCISQLSVKQHLWNNKRGLFMQTTLFSAVQQKVTRNRSQQIIKNITEIWSELEDWRKAQL
jgi:hypothetical protein